MCPDSDGKRKLAGIVSFGNVFCIKMAVFSKVSYYDEWIQNQINVWDKISWLVQSDFKNSKKSRNDDFAELSSRKPR